MQAGTLSVKAASGLGAAGVGNETTVTNSVLSIDNVTSAEAVTLDTNGVLLGTGTASLTGALSLEGVNHFIGTPLVGDSLTLSGAITGVDGYNKVGAGTVVVTNDGNTYTGVTNVQGGTLSVTADNGLGAAGAGNETTVVATLSLDGANSPEDVTLNTNATLRGTGLAELSGVLTLAGANHTITTPANGDPLTLSGAITGSGGYSKLGAGTVVLSNAGNDYTGVTAVQAGTLSVTDGNGLGATGAGNETTVTTSVLSLDDVASAEAVTLDTNGTLRHGLGEPVGLAHTCQLEPHDHDAGRPGFADAERSDYRVGWLQQARRGYACGNKQQTTPTPA